jgi:hypothetical protein
MKPISDADYQLEIDCRQMVVDRLARTLTKLKKDAEVERATVVARQAELRDLYPTEDDAHEAWGYGYITEDEYKTIAGQLAEANNPSVTSAARDVLRDMLARLRQEIRDLKWEALPEAERERIRNSTADYKDKLKRLKEVHADGS